MRFLIVDDNQGMRRTIEMVVTQDGDEVIECEDGKDALELYTKHHPDWVLMDISMKNVNGIEATEQITEIDPGARVVIVTEYEDRFFRKAAHDAGAFAFISKEQLRDIKKLIGRE
jgi:DNA-binding NarL/FixJ family response regulator